MDIVWAHNFDSRVSSSGVFMHTLAQGMTSEGVTPRLVYLGNLRRPFEIARAMFTLRRAAEDADLIHAQFGSLCGLVASTVRKPRVLSLRGSDWYRLGSPAPIMDLAHSFIATTASRRSLARFQSVVVMSERMRADVSREFAEARISVIPDGIDLGAFKPIEIGMARKKLGCAEDTDPWVLFPSVQTRNTVKREELAAAAVSIARRSIPSLRLRLVTGVPHSEMPTVVNASSVVLSTSSHEGWPNSIKEALACNVPFVSTDVSDLAEIATLEPTCSVTSDDPGALAAGLVRAILAPRSQTLRSRIESMDYRQAARRLIAVYREALKT